MVDGPEVQVGLQLSVGGLYLADEVVVVPSRAPVYFFQDGLRNILSE